MNSVGSRGAAWTIVCGAAMEKREVQGLHSLPKKDSV